MMKRMSAVSHRTGIGPMSGVAGAFALRVATMLKKKLFLQGGRC